MMLYPSMAQLLEKINSRYLLVNVIAKRAREIAAEAEDQGERLEEKPVSMAIEEIAQGKITAHVSQDESEIVVNGETEATADSAMEAENEGKVEIENAEEEESEGEK